MHALKKTSVILIILYMMNTPFFLLHIIKLNTGIELSLPIPVLFLAIPLFFLLSSAAFNKSFRAPYLLHFFLIEILFLILETNFIRGIDYFPDYSYSYQLFIFYTLFISLINFGITSSQIKKIVKYYLFVAFVIITIVFLGYAGMINYFVDTAESERNALRPLGGGIHTNGLSIIAAISILLLTLNKLNNKSYIKLIRWQENLLVLYFLTMILYNSSRGAFIITVVMIFFFIKADWNRMKLSSKFVISFLGIATTGYFISITLFESVLLIQRFQDTSQWISRVSQIIVTWENFINNPLIGVGFYEAARNVISGYTRSNFHYSQILASNGIFYFILYFWFLVRLFGNKLRNPAGLMFISFCFISLMFYNWSIIFSLSLVAYLNYVYKRS